VSSYPLSLDVAGKLVVVIGAGAVAARRARGLVDAGALVTVISPAISEAMSELGDSVRLVRREYLAGDLEGAWLAHAATDKPAVNEAVAAEAQVNRIWCIRADDHSASDAWTPASTTVDDVTIAVTSADPRRSVALRSSIAAQLRSGDLPVKARRAHDGHVVLIGGGPGDADLITVRGRRELNKADVVIYDRLAPLELLASLDDDVELINAGKQPDRHTLPQEQINELLIDRARAGKRVARLKGGDPFVLGRGSEEMLACIEAGVTVEVIPGVTSAISAPLAAGIPVTHRGVTTGFIVMSGHEIGDLDLAAKSDLTLVVLMGVGRLGRLVEGLVASGKSSSTPIAIIERAYAPDQRVTVGTLASIVEIAAAEHVANPAIIIVGDVVSVPTWLTAGVLTAHA
jgi:uroporphyrin-III C-methyltransferase/precorrin-2 dehydrogenase/sirohydrochlorin ferrochelatase